MGSSNISPSAQGHICQYFLSIKFTTLCRGWESEQRGGNCYFAYWGAFPDSSNPSAYRHICFQPSFLINIYQIYISHVPFSSLISFKYTHLFLLFSFPILHAFCYKMFFKNLSQITGPKKFLELLRGEPPGTRVAIKCQLQAGIVLLYVKML